MGKRVLASSLLLLILLSLSVPLVPAGGELKASTPNPYDRRPSLWKDFSKVLSGSTGLMIEGVDYRLTRGKSEALQELSPGGERRLQAAAAALVPYRSPTQKFSRNILITRDYSSYPFQTEPHLAVDPRDPDRLVVGVIDYAFPNVVSYTSIDGGVTWQGPYLPRYLEDDLGAGGDPIVAFDRKGNSYIAYISVGFEEFSIGGIPYADFVSSIALAKSTDGGVTWGKPYPSSRSHIISKYSATAERGRSAGTLSLGFLDKPWMTVGPNPARSGEDIVYITYTHFKIIWEVFYILGGELFIFSNPILETTIELVSSTDGGQTWNKPIVVSPVARWVGTSAQGEGQFTADRRVLQGSQVSVSSDGTVYVAWLDSTDDDSFKGLMETWFSKSSDGGKTFSKGKSIAAKTEPAFSSRNALFRSWASAFPQIATGLRDEVYVVFVGRDRAGRPTDDGDLYFLRSFDKGENWSSPKIVNTDRTNRFQFFPSVTADPKGNIHMMWGDFRDDPYEVSFNIYYTRSEDRGATWVEEARVTDFPSKPNYGFPRGVFIGDYFSIKATEKNVYMVWADTRLGEFGPLNQKIGFARTELMPASSIFVSPPRGPGGRDVTIQGFNFQPNHNMFIEVGGVLVSTARTNPEGRFETKIFIPISGEGTHTVNAIDESGNIASASFFVDFGFDNLRDAQKDASNAVQKLSETLSSVQKDLKSITPAQQAELSKKIDEIAAQLKQFSQSLEANRNDLGITSQFPIIGTSAAIIIAAAALAVALMRKGRAK